ncbi:hypothetical protein BpHYR1_019588 [Brachionus plicatilis]|uniref:Uncharacterized protein n=1 Tax=Brachionus plicatilis TaxID=10195 RepID=A0A3M7SIC9_BRAPC|nr:hypothetical protein BpHYR1_019588 [Brachionus plicatilis]
MYLLHKILFRNLENMINKYTNDLEQWMLSNKKSGLNQKTLGNLYKSLVGSILDYSFPCLNSFSEINIKKLQAIQNATLTNRLFELSERYFGTGLYHSIPLVVRLVEEYKEGFESRYIEYSTPLLSFALELLIPTPSSVFVGFRRFELDLVVILNSIMSESNIKTVEFLSSNYDITEQNKSQPKAIVNGDHLNKTKKYLRRPILTRQVFNIKNRIEKLEYSDGKKNIENLMRQLEGRFSHFKVKKFMNRKPKCERRTTKSQIYVDF